MSVRKAKTKISLGIRLILPESMLFAQWVTKHWRSLLADSKDSDQTELMHSYIYMYTEPKL